MTVNEWLEARRPQPPAALSVKVKSALGEAGNERDIDVAAICLTAGERIVSELLKRDCTNRDSAPDLLAADALVTYAFEAASQVPATLVAHAESAMRRIAVLASESSP